MNPPCVGSASLILLITIRPKKCLIEFWAVYFIYQSNVNWASWTPHELISSDPKWLFHSTVKSGHIPLSTSQKKEENDFKWSKGRVLALSVMFGFRSILVLLFHFVSVVMVTGFWTHIQMNSAIFTKFSFRKIAARERENSCISIGCILLKNL